MCVDTLHKGDNEDDDDDDDDTEEEEKKKKNITCERKIEIHAQFQSEHLELNGQ
jgi:hypothetical protein